MARTRSARQTARPITPAVVTGHTGVRSWTPEWEQEADQAENALVDVRNYLAELRKGIDGLQGDSQALEALLGPLVDEEEPGPLLDGSIGADLAGPIVVALRKALTIINELGRRGEVADDLAHKAATEAEGIDLARLKEIASERMSEEERADEAEGKVEDLEEQIKALEEERMSDEEIGALLVRAGWSEPPNGWTRLRVTETLEQLAWNVSLLQARGGR